MANTVDAKLLRQTKFPQEFNRKVDMTRVNVEVMKKWIAGKISGILGSEDDVVVELCFNLLEGARYPDIKSLQIQLTGFLDKDTPKFCKELWNLCLSAQDSPQGVPKELLEAKKLELMQEKIDAERASEGARQRAERDSRRERDMETIRRREQTQRSHATNRNTNIRERYADEDYDPSRTLHRRGGRNRSRSPPSREGNAYRSREPLRNGREGSERRNHSRSPYRRSRNDHHQSSYARRHSYSTESGSRSPKPRREKRYRNRSRSATPLSDHASDKRRKPLSRSQSPTRRKSGRASSSDAHDARKQNK